MSSEEVINLKMNNVTSSGIFFSDGGDQNEEDYKRDLYFEFTRYLKIS